MDLRELFEILRQGEGPLVEFKSAFPPSAHAMAKEMAALANSGGGILLLGVTDDGSPLGIADPNQAIERLAGTARSCSPPLRPEINKILLSENVSIVYARVPAGPPCLYQGKFYHRVGSTSIEASGGDELRDLLGILKKSPPKKSGRAPSTLFSPPPVRGFCGRTRELSRLATFLSSEVLSIIVLEGISGIGKTALAARFASSAPQYGYEPFWLDCRSDTSFNSVTSALASFAQSSGHDGFAETLEDPSGTLEERIARISAGVAEHALALFFDDYHLVTDPLVNRLLHKIGERSLRSKIFLICRQRPRMAVISSPRLLVEETLHEGIDFAACTEYLLSCGLDVADEIMRKIWSVTGEGHPKALEIFVARSRAYPVSDLLSSLPVFREELTNEWLAPLVNEFPQEQKDVAIDLSAFDRVIPLRALPWLYPDKDVRPLILGLVDRFILDFVANESLRMHMLIREFCYPQLPDKAAKHSWVAEYYLHEAESAANPEAPTEEEITARTSAWIHLLKAEDYARARVQLQNLRSPLMNRGQYEQIMFLLDNTPTTPETELWWTIDKARIRGLWGEVDAAVEILRPLTESEDLAVASESVLVLATLYLEAKDGAAALAVLERYRDRFTKTIADPTAPRNLSRARRRFLSRLIEAHLILGDSQRAYEWAKKMIEVCQVEEDEYGGAMSLRQMAGVLVGRGEHATAIQLYRASVDLLRKMKREREIGITQRLLGTAYLAAGDLPSSQHYLEDAMRIFTVMGDRPNSSICRLEMRKLRDAQLSRSQNPVRHG